MVLVEAGADNPWRLMRNGKLVRSADLITEKAAPPVQVSGRLRLSDISPDALRQMRTGAQENARHANDPRRDRLPADAQQMRTWALAQLGHVVAAVNPFENEELAGFRADRLKSEHALGTMPLIVLTRGKSEEEGSDGKPFEEEHRQDHETLAKMSTNSKLIVAEHSGHDIQIEEPGLVVKAIQDVIAALRK